MTIRSKRALALTILSSTLYILLVLSTDNIKLSVEMLTKQNSPNFIEVFLRNREDKNFLLEKSSQIKTERGFFQYSFFIRNVLDIKRIRIDLQNGNNKTKIPEPVYLKSIKLSGSFLLNGYELDISEGDFVTSKGVIFQKEGELTIASFDNPDPILILKPKLTLLTLKNGLFLTVWFTSFFSIYYLIIWVNSIRKKEQYLVQVTVRKKYLNKTLDSLLQFEFYYKKIQFNASKRNASIQFTISSKSLTNTHRELVKLRSANFIDNFSLSNHLGIFI